jgi:hypothetical protein
MKYSKSEWQRIEEIRTQTELIEDGPFLDDEDMHKDPLFLIAEELRFVHAELKMMNLILDNKNEVQASIQKYYDQKEIIAELVSEGLSIDEICKHPKVLIPFDSVKFEVGMLSFKRKLKSNASNKSK